LLLKREVEPGLPANCDGDLRQLPNSAPGAAYTYDGRYAHRSFACEGDTGGRLTLAFPWPPAPTGLRGASEKSRPAAFRDRHW